MFDPLNEKRNALILHYAANGMPKYYDALSGLCGDTEELILRIRERDRSLCDEIPERVRKRLTEASAEAFTDLLFEQLERMGVDVVVKGTPEYPELLNEIDLAPNLLFVKGKLPERPELPIAVVGSRKSTEYGRQIAETLSFGLREAGALIVSGMAYGIDSCAARGALSSKREGVPTVAVLGTGIDVIYPAENRSLYEQIAERGAVISEFWPGTQARRDTFPTRNRIMSGMSKGVLVVEAGEHSGTIHTVGYAHDQGREVFAVPGRLTDVMSIGTNRLIREGAAKPVFCVEDILEEFLSLSELAQPQKPERMALSSLDETSRRIVAALLSGEMDVDSLQEHTGLPVALLNAKLTVLSFSGVIDQLPGKVFALNAQKIDTES